MNNQRNEFTQEQIDEISNNNSVVDYFLYLEKQGIVNFERKTGHDFYFRTENNKYSVNNTGFYDFKTGEGGGIIKAVMNTQNKTERSFRISSGFLRSSGLCCGKKTYKLIF